MASAIIEELISKFTLDDKGYDEGGKKVMEMTEKIRGVVDGVVGHIKDAFSRVFDGLKNPVAMLLGGLGLMDLGKHAIEAAMSWDFLTRSMTAVTHSAERAQQVMAFVEKLELPSIFGDKDLAAAAMRLEALGLQTERFLPLAEKLGTVFGGTPEVMMEVVHALGMIKGGMTGRGFEELERMGMSKDEFKTMGLHFTKAGEMTSPIKEALDAIEKLVNQKYGQLSNTVGGSFQAKWATFTNTIEIAFRKVGTVILDYVMPAVGTITGAIEKLVSGGTIKKMADQLTSVFGTIDLKKVKEFAIDFIAGLETIPTVVQIVADHFKKFFTWIGDHFGLLKDIMLAVFGAAVVWKIVQGIGFIVTAVKALVIAFKSLDIAEMIADALNPAGLVLLLGAGAAVWGAWKGLSWMMDNGAGPLPGKKDIDKDLQSTEDAFNKNKNSLSAALAGGDGDKPGATTLAEKAAEAAKALPEAITQQNGYLTKIEHNTRESANSLKAYALGGGDIGRLGVSKTEMAGYYRSQHSPRGAGGTMGKITAAIRELIEEEISAALAHGNRQRYFTPS